MRLRWWQRQYPPTLSDLQNDADRIFRIVRTTTRRCTLNPVGVHRQLVNHRGRGAAQPSRGGQQHPAGEGTVVTDRHTLVTTIAEAIAEVDNLTAAIADVVLLHEIRYTWRGQKLCNQCECAYPCPTVQLLTRRGLA